VNAMWLMLQQDHAEDYVVSTGVETSVRDFVRLAFQEIGVEIEFKGEGIDELGIVVRSENPDFLLAPGREVVAIDPRYFRPAEVDLLIGDNSKAREKLGWQPTYDLKGLVQEMVAADLDLFRQNRVLKEAGFLVKNEFE
jgi:GDPmannose 4,6-dehydratase